MTDSNNEKFYSLGDIFRILKLFLVYAKRKWWLTVLFAIAGAGLGALYYSVQKPRYEAQCSFILEEKQQGMGGLGSIASQFGLDVGGLSGGGGLFAGDNILDILKSQKVIRQVLLGSVNDTAAQSPTLADLYLDFSGSKKRWENQPGLQSINFAASKNKMGPVEDSVLNSVYEAVVKKYVTADRISKKGTIISVQVKAENSLFARLMAERLVDEASKLYFTLKTATAQLNVDRLQHRSDSLLLLLNRKSYTAAAAQPLDINPGLKSASVPVEIATRDKSVVATLYTEVTKNLEASKLLLSQYTPVIQLLDRPGLLLEDKRKGRFFLAVIFALAAAVASVGLLGLFFAARRLKAA